jgi:hypothetical protein
MIEGAALHVPFWIEKGPVLFVHADEARIAFPPISLFASSVVEFLKKLCDG